MRSTRVAQVCVDRLGTRTSGAAMAYDHRTLVPFRDWNDGIVDQCVPAYCSSLELPGINSSIRPLFDYGERRVRGVV